MRTFTFSNNKQSAQDLYNKGMALYLENKHQQAVEVLESAAELDPDHHQSLGLLGQITRENGYTEESIECYALAIQANNNHAPYKQAFLDLITYRPIIAFNQAMKDIILGCLVTDEVDLSTARIPWHGLLQHDPDFKPYLKLLKQKSYDDFERVFLDIKNYSILCDPYFLTGLQKLIIYKIEFESFLTHLRRFFLQQAKNNQNPLNEAQTLMLLSCLARYCHETEYIFAMDSTEQQTINALRTKIENGEGEDMDIALCACYTPLATLKNAVELERIYTSHPALSDTVFHQITTIFKREHIKRALPALTPINNEISVKVRDQYENYPYPRWKAFDHHIKNDYCEGFLERGKPNILVAGCGTGKEALELAYVFPNASVLAVDLSLSSLSYGYEKAQEFGIKNVRFEHADLLELGSLEERFDYIASSGVLHHIDKPEEGLSTLCGLLKKGGTMRLAFYSRLARSGINKTRGEIKAHNISNDDEGIRNFRANIKTYIDKKTFENISFFTDYFSMSECRDLIFHVQEHQYDLKGLKKLLEDNDLSFKQFYLHPDILNAYAKMFPDDPAQTNLSHWAKFEERNPKTFTEMYRFWCVKK